MDDLVRTHFAVSSFMVACAGFLALPCLVSADPILLQRSHFEASVADGPGGLTPGQYTGTSTNRAGSTQQSLASVSYDMTNSAVTQLAVAQAIGDVLSNDGSPPVSSAEGLVTYFFIIRGPDPSQLVPTVLTASGVTTLSGSVSSTDFALAKFDIKAVGSQLALTSSDEACSGMCTKGDTPTFAFNTTPSLPVDQVFQVDLDAKTMLAEGQAGSFGADAAMDPAIFIDPSWVFGHPGYSIEFSQAPEPATFLTLGLGLLTLLGARYCIRTG
jgi:hypothetical protein